MDDYVASGLTETPAEEHGDVLTDINLPCKRNRTRVAHYFKSNLASEDWQAPTISPLSEYERIDITPVQDSCCTAQSPRSQDGSIPSTAPSVEGGTIEVSGTQIPRPTCLPPKTKSMTNRFQVFNLPRTNGGVVLQLFRSPVGLKRLSPSTEISFHLPWCLTPLHPNSTCKDYHQRRCSYFASLMLLAVTEYLSCYLRSV